LAGPQSWNVLDWLGIPGFGTDLIRIDFPPPIRPSPLWGQGKEVHPELAAILAESRALQEQWLQRCLEKASECQHWPENEDSKDATLPWKQNMFLTMLDMVALYGVIAEAKPSLYLEIGSGISTRVAWQARRGSSHEMKIFSIDPNPRVEVEQLCDRVFRKRLEEIPPAELAEMSGAGTAVFFDGSHRCFPKSDVTVFFLEILPRLKPGTLVHIHDIYLPFDYPEPLMNRYWSEQYILAAFLLGGAKNIRIILPCHNLLVQETTKKLISEKVKVVKEEASSCWIEIVC
jgi:predicted O-methyltransferase YrrM